MNYTQEHYGVPSDIGRIIAYNGRQGVISEDRGHYVGVTFDDEKPGTVGNFHPTTEGLEYLGMGKVRPMTRSQQRYKDFIRADTDQTFSEWMGFCT